MPGVFPTLPSGRYDASTYQVEIEDTVIRSPTEGGYVFTRPRHTRAPKSTYRVALRMLTTADMNTLRDFFKAMRGDYFTWVSPQNGVTYTVRFTEGAMPFRYVGRGLNQFWDCELSLQEV